MNEKATQALAMATSLIAKGDGFYRKAVEWILAAQKADPALTNREIGRYIGEAVRSVAYSERWVRNLVTWGTTSERAATPFGGEEETARKARSHARSILANASAEEVERVISELPRDRQRVIGAAAGNAYLRARQEYEEAEKQMTPEELDARDQAEALITRATSLATAEFTTLGIIGHLEQATEELRELNADASLTPDMARKIDHVLDAFVTEFRFARALLGEDRDD